MPEAWCAACLSPCSPMIVSGWGMCKHCRSMKHLDFGGLNQEVHSASAREFIRNAIKKALRKAVA